MPQDILSRWEKGVRLLSLKFPPIRDTRLSIPSTTVTTAQPLCHTTQSFQEAMSVSLVAAHPALMSRSNLTRLVLELTLEDYMRELVAVFREVRRVLADDGNLWLNLGDSYEDKELLGVPWRVAFALQVDGRHKRDVWTIATRSFKGSHFAVMPEALAEPCVLAASEVGGVGARLLCLLGDRRGGGQAPRAPHCWCRAEP